MQDSWWNPLSPNSTSNQLYQTVLDFLLHPLVFFLGVTAGIVNCLVFRRQGLQERMNLCLFCISLVDMAFVCSQMALNAVSYVKLVDETLGEEYVSRATATFAGVLFAFREASGCISLVIALERCACVFLPLRIDTLMRTRTMAALLAAIVVTSQAAHVPFPLRHDVGRIGNCTGKVVWVTVETKLYEDNKLLFVVLDQYFSSFVLPVGTLFGVSLSTAITLIKLKLALEWRTGASTGGSFTARQMALTRVLVLHSCIYIACSAPLAMLTLTSMIVAEFTVYSRYSNLFLLTYSSVGVISALQSSLNFVLYYTFSSRYKHALGEVCCAKKRHSSKLSTTELFFVSESGK